MKTVRLPPSPMAEEPVPKKPRHARARAACRWLGALLGVMTVLVVVVPVIFSNHGRFAWHGAPRWVADGAVAIAYASLWLWIPCLVALMIAARVARKKAG